MAEKSRSDDSSSSQESSDEYDMENGTGTSGREKQTSKQGEPRYRNNSRTKKRDFSHPVYKNISQFNGQVNKMRRNEIVDRLKKYGMDINGATDILKQRLKNCYRKRKLVEASVSEQKSKLDYIVVIDYEATCEADVMNYRHEIIEFPAVLMNVTDGSLVDEFREYCKPIENPKLTKFCKNLTGIQQSDVDGAHEFPQVLENFEKWLKSHRLGTKRGFKFAVATDGPWDMRRFLYYQCKMVEIKFPKWAQKWVNLRKLFSNFYKRERGNIENMLRYLGLEFEGRQHCGMDDTRNIARIAQRLICDGCFINVNEGFAGNEQSQIQNIKPEKPQQNHDFPVVVPVNLKTEAEKQKDKEVREALRKLQIQSDDELAAFYKSINKY